MSLQPANKPLMAQGGGTEESASKALLSPLGMSSFQKVSIPLICCRR